MKTAAAVRAGRVGDRAHCPCDAHHCSSCAHSVAGPAISGSPNVLVNGRHMLRVDDRGTHAQCCGPNVWVATKGAMRVLVNGKLAHRLGDRTIHCGGKGQLVQGSPDVLIGNYTKKGQAVRAWRRIAAVDDRGVPIPSQRIVLQHEHSPEIEAISGRLGFLHMELGETDQGVNVALASRIEQTKSKIGGR